MSTQKKPHQSKVIITALLLLIANIGELIAPQIPQLQAMVADMNLPPEVRYWINMALGALIVYFRFKSTSQIVMQKKTEDATHTEQPE